MRPRRPSARAQARGTQRPRLTAQGLQLGNRTVPILSGAVHYFRLPRHHWRPALEAVRDLGLTMVESYVPWGVHEAPDGSLDFGEEDPGKDLGAFLDLAEELELLVFLRPGPNVNAELPYFGLPARVVLEQDCQARSPSGARVPVIAPPRMFPAPSYASRRFLAHARDWLSAFARKVAGRVWPDGPLVLLQVDNEAAFFFRDGPYDQDYHPDALIAYQEFLRERYGRLRDLAGAYEIERPPSWAAVEPPRTPPGESRGELLRAVDWAEHQERLLAGALREMGEALADAGLAHVPRTHNLAMGDAGSALSLGAASRVVDTAGLDYYHGRRGLGEVKRRTLRLASVGKPPLSPELGIGAPPWFGARSDEDSLQSALGALAYGLRGFNLYMAVDRSLWYGGAARDDGGARPLAERLKQLVAALVQTDFHRLERRAAVALQLPAEYARWSRATHMLGPLSPTLLSLAGLAPNAASSRRNYGFARPIQLAWWPLIERMAAALSRLGVPYVYVGSEDASLPHGVRVVIAPTFEVVCAERWTRLGALARSGVEIVWGPERPTLDAMLRPLEVEAPSGEPRLRCADATEADRLVQELAETLELSPAISVSPPPLEVAVHRDAGEARVLFVVNPGADDQVAELHLDAPATLVGVFAGERFDARPVARVPVGGHSCRMLLVEHGHPGGEAAP